MNWDSWDSRYNILRYKIWDMPWDTRFEIWDSRYKIWDMPWDMYLKIWDLKYALRYKIWDMYLVSWDTTFKICLEIHILRYEIWDTPWDTRFKIQNMWYTLRYISWDMRFQIQDLRYISHILRYDMPWDTIRYLDQWRWIPDFTHQPGKMYSPSIFILNHKFLFIIFVHNFKYFSLQIISSNISNESLWVVDSKCIYNS